jgi:hypothetical protein
MPGPGSNIESALTPVVAPTNPSQQSFITKKEIGDLDFTVEFNDSVLSLAGWNNPRYNGSKLQASNLNTFTNGDITYGKSSVVQKYTKNVYIGTAITNLKNPEEDNLVQFPSASYVNISKVFTIGRDLETDDFLFGNDESSAKIGFYRSFFDDFPNGKNISLIPLDNTIPNLLKDTYNVYFNGGKLSKAITVANNGESAISVSQTLFQYAGTSPSDSTNLSDNNLTATLHTEVTDKYFISSSVTTHGQLDDFFEQTLTHINSNPGKNRFFITLGHRSGFEFAPINREFTNRKAFKTFEIQKSSDFSRIISLSSKFKPDSQDDDFADSNKLAYIVSQLDDSVPSLLVELDLENQLPSGIGELPVIIIPHNLHPFLKDNLIYILSTAGVDIGRTQVPQTINVKNQTLT